MSKETDEKLACSLTAETTELIPFLPYLLQDLWELGTTPRDMIRLIKKHITMSENTKILELACGKGAAAVNIAKEFGVKVYGFDLLPDFIEYAKQKAKEYCVDELCHFAVGDADEIINAENGYDLVIFGAAGNILGSPEETLQKLCKTIKRDGYIIMDATYLPRGVNTEELKWEYEYIRREDWLRLFDNNGLELAEELLDTEEYDYESETAKIVSRANELIALHPEKREMFEGYIRSQQSEVNDIENALVVGVWLLQKV